MSGKVFIVGAGPGDPGLITMRGLQCIRAADVLVYDRLVHPSLLKEAPAHAEHVYVGKEADHHTLGQESINELLAMHAMLGRNVVRLKGGDPFVFGRGGEEAVFLAERGINFEVVPGISSAIAVPAFAGIPITQRGVSSSFAVVTGHLCGNEIPVDYAAMLRSVGTLVILMGVRSFPAIARQLLDGAIDKSTPVAFIEQGTHESQRTLVTTLDNAIRDSREVQPPAVIVVGNVVSLREQIEWFHEAAHISAHR
jgi:uroporphyrin-III C-methyltransferase